MWCAAAACAGGAHRRRPRCRRRRSSSIYICRGGGLRELYVLPMTATLRSRHPNLMLRCMRAMRIMLIEPTWWRIRYVKLYCALRIMGPDTVPAMGGRHACRSMRQILVSRIMQNLLYDVENPGAMENGRPTCSGRLAGQISDLEAQMRVTVGGQQRV